MRTHRFRSSLALTTLAGALLVSSLAIGCGDTLNPSEAIDHLGQLATVCGDVASAHHASRSRGRPTFLNLGRPYPDHVFTIVIWGEHRSKFGRPERDLDGVAVCVTGQVSAYRGRAQIVVESPRQLRRMDD
jgi:hypothetical protein